MKRARFSSGSVLFDKGRGTWRFLQWIDGKRRSQTIGTKREFPTKAAAQKAAQSLTLKPSVVGPTVMALVEQYRVEKMPTRHDTRAGYESWLSVYILPKWAGHTITDLQARPVELWFGVADVGTEEQGSHSRRHQCAVEVRHVEARRTDAGESDQSRHDQRRVQARTATARSHG